MKRVLNNLVLLLVMCLSIPSATSWAQAPASINDKRFLSTDKAVEELITEKQIAGAVVLIAKGNQILHFKAYGQRDVEEKSPMQTDSIFRIYSMTKPITSTAILILVERGLIELDAPIHRYIPELKGIKVYGWLKNSPPKQEMTIRHLLTHTSGLTYGYFSNTEVDKQYNKNHPLHSKDNRSFINKLKTKQLLYHPGEKWHYSVATDVLGHLIERISGQTLGVFFEENIFKPLNMKDTSFSVKEKQTQRFTSSYGDRLKLVDHYKRSHFKKIKRIQSGGGGLLSTASDYLQFCQMILNGGELGGRRLLKRETIKAMTKNQLPDGVFAYSLFGFGYGFKVQLHNWANRAKRGEIDWNGAASTHFWITPSERLTVIALSQRQPYSNQLKKKIKPLIYRAISKP